MGLKVRLPPSTKLKWSAPPDVRGLLSCLVLLRSSRISMGELQLHVSSVHSADTTQADTTGTFSGLALWLSPRPSSSADTSLRNLLQSLSNTHQTPSFAPHVTLLTGIPTDTPLEPLLATLKQAVEGVQPFQLQYSELGTHGTFFQYLFAGVVLSPELLDLRRRVQAALTPSAGPDTVYFPHLSLMYGQDSEETPRRKVEDILEQLRGKEGEAVRSAEGFEASSVLVVKCEGPPEQWEVLSEVELQP